MTRKRQKSEDRTGSEYDDGACRRRQKGHKKEKRAMEQVTRGQRGKHKGKDAGGLHASWKPTSCAVVFKIFINAILSAAFIYCQENFFMLLTELNVRISHATCLQETNPKQCKIHRIFFTIS